MFWGFKYSSKYLEYIQYVADTLRSFGIQQAGKICELAHLKHVCYTYSSLSYTELLPLRKIWYPEGKKVVPHVIQLTPITCRQWYIGDGSLTHRHGKRPYIRLSTNAFPYYDVAWLVEQLWEIGILATHQPASNCISTAACSTKDFITYIGECPVECYKYKWDYEKRM